MDHILVYHIPYMTYHTGLKVGKVISLQLDLVILGHVEAEMFFNKALESMKNTLYLNSPNL